MSDWKWMETFQETSEDGMFLSSSMSVTDISTEAQKILISIDI